ncbi:MAG TPA: chemotaxis protein CheB [Streptosporangiales bacterium]
MSGIAGATRAERVIAIGASAGGVDALQTLLARVPTDLTAPVLIVLHLPATGNSVLPRILERRCPLPVAFAGHGQPLVGGRVYVAPPDHHLVVVEGAVELSHGPKENASRPAIDVLLRTAAAIYGPRVIGVVLSGNLDDGAAGLKDVVTAGGVGVVQDPNDAAYPDMPRNAIRHASPQYVLPLSGISDLLEELGTTPVEGAQTMPDIETSDPVTGDNSGWGMSCPDCSGVLHQVGTNPLRFRCRVGHAWTEHNLMDKRDDEIENALWIAVRSLEEKKELLERMAKQSEAGGWRHSTSMLRARATNVDTALTVLRDLLLQPTGVGRD